MRAGARAPKIAAPCTRPMQHTVRNNHHRVSVCAARQARVVFWTLAFFCQQQQQQSVGRSTIYEYDAVARVTDKLVFAHAPLFRVFHCPESHFTGVAAARFLVALFLARNSLHFALFRGGVHKNHFLHNGTLSDCPSRRLAV